MILTEMYQQQLKLEALFKKSKQVSIYEWCAFQNSIIKCCVCIFQNDFKKNPFLKKLCQLCSFRPKNIQIERDTSQTEFLYAQRIKVCIQYTSTAFTIVILRICERNTFLVFLQLLILRIGTKGTSGEFERLRLFFILTCQTYYIRHT